MITSTLLETFPELLHAFTDRRDGRSIAPYDTLNLAYHVGDDDETVDANHALLAEKLGYDPRRLIHMRQIHSDRVVRCTPGMTFDTRPECDALITDIPGQALMVMVADCTPVLLYDPAHHAVAAIHAGRAGALKDIVTRTVERMQETYGSEAADLRAVLGPAIHGCCYEINNAIADAVMKAGCGDALEHRKGAPYLDVNRILLRQLEQAGISSGHIDISNNCTSCRHDRFFSYRADRQQTGRQAGIIMLK